MARRRAPLEALAADLASIGATAHVITADLPDTDAVPRLTGQIRGVDRRSKAPRRGKADIVRALTAGWPSLVTAGVCGVVLAGRLALAGQWSIRTCAVRASGYREEGRPSVSGWACR